MKKYVALFTLIIVPLLCVEAPPMKINTARLLLTKLRGGDYAHVGDKEAVDLVFQKASFLNPEIKAGNCLDVGSGFGGTAGDFYQLGCRSIWGIDLDSSAVGYAKAHYPHIAFMCADAQKLQTLFDSHFFSFIYLFNVAYAIENKQELLASCSAVAKPGAILALFDYTSDSELPLKDLAGKPMYPINLNTIKNDLLSTGWEVVEVLDLTNQYIEWYNSLLHKLSEQKSTLALEFSNDDIVKVGSTYTLLLDYLEKGKLGGTLLIATKKVDL